jgi:hypothetical protein
MKAWFSLLKARTVFSFAVVLVVAGLGAVLYFVALFVWQIALRVQAGSWVPFPATLLFSEHSLAFIPEFPWAAPEALASILDRLHLGLVFALPGLAAMALGVLVALRQKALIRALTQREEDRLRRVRDYRREGSAADAWDGRREPFIGPSGTEPFIGPGGTGRDADRRAA